MRISMRISFESCKRENQRMRMRIDLEVLNSVDQRETHEAVRRMVMSGQPPVALVEDTEAERGGDSVCIDSHHRLLRCCCSLGFLTLPFVYICSD